MIQSRILKKKVKKFLGPETAHFDLPIFSLVSRGQNGRFQAPKKKKKKKKR
jgi:hypothetical protein